MKRMFTVFLALLLVGANASSQSMEETMKNLGMEAGEKFVQPIVTGFGMNLNGGWFHKSPQAKIFGIDLELGFVAMGTMTSDEDKTFSLNGAFQFGGGPRGSNSEAEKLAQGIPNYNLLNATQQQQVIDAIASKSFTVAMTGPTVVGSKNDKLSIDVPTTTITVAGVPGGSVTIPATNRVMDEVTGLLDGAAMIPLAAPQLSIGTVFGTQATFRYLPEYDMQDLGKFKYFGFGVQHNLGMWLPIPIVDVSASFFTQNLKIGTLMEAKSTSFGLNVSKQFGFAFLNLTPYGGFMLESSTMNFGYDFPVYKDPSNPANDRFERISFELEGANKSRITLGLSIRLLIININADYNIGKQNSATAGVFFAF
ncbi:MAG: hypothetical protein F9K22_12980 [Bacteroidetes bacterium]|nr:MAG: hypothetical protein F9K22_12980 [Bacteroidota bacterium]